MVSGTKEIPEGRGYRTVVAILKFKCFKVVVASGDSGANGVFLTAAPATGRNVISTGSIDNRLVAAHVLDIKGMSHGSIGK